MSAKTGAIHRFMAQGGQWRPTAKLARAIDEMEWTPPCRRRGGEGGRKGGEPSQDPTASKCQSGVLARTTEGQEGSP